MNDNKVKIVLDVAYQPQVRTETDTRRIMMDVIIALMPALIVSIFQFGWRPLGVAVVSMLSAVFFEWAYRKLLKKSNTIGDCSAAVTGLLMAMTMPPTSPLWLPIVGSFFSIVIVKQLYGGLGKNFLNPALAGRAFLIASYANHMTSWAVPNGLKSVVDATTMATPMTYMYTGEAMPEYLSFTNMFLGNMPGCIGEISSLALLIGVIYLFVRKVITWRIPTSFIATVVILTFVFGHEGYSRIEWVGYNIFAGSLLLGAFFMANDYATSPVTGPGQIIYGIGCGAITVLIRYFGSYPEGVSYAILIMNLCTWAIDKAFCRPQFGVTKEDLAAQKAAKKAAKAAAKEGA
jgi:Na+-translocating ferredoxin:NAD+ oxidoreductase subunit D